METEKGDIGLDEAIEGTKGEVVGTSLERPAEGAPIDADQNNVSPPDLQDQEVRSTVASILSTAVVDDVEIERYVSELVDTQYEGSMDTLKLGTKPLYNQEQPQEGDIPAPNLEQAKDILAKQVTPQQLEVIKKMEKPTLQLIPVTSMARYAEFLDGHKPMKGQNDAYISDWQKKAFVRADERDGVSDNKSIVRWQIAVTEGAKEPKLLDGDDVNKTLEERGQWFTQEYAKKGVKGVDLKRMVALMMDSLKTGQPMNDYWKQDGTWAFVNEEGEKDGSVSGVGWLACDRLVLLGEPGAGDQADRARLRASVVINVPESR